MQIVPIVRINPFMKITRAFGLILLTDVKNYLLYFCKVALKHNSLSLTQVMPFFVLFEEVPQNNFI